jgi:heat shock protein HslJ
MHTARLAGAVAAVLPLLLLAACGDDGGAGAEGAPDPSGDWTLSEGTGPDGPIPIVEGAPITLSITPDRWGGVSACNSYGATVELDGDQVRIVDGVAVTEMACLDEDVMASEAAYLAAFQLIDRVEVGDEQLLLRGPEVELVYTGVAPEPDAALVDTEWHLEALVEGVGPDGAVSSVWGEPTLRLSDDGTLAGSTGCNRFNGSYELDGTTLRVGPLATTRMACEDGLAAQEEHVLDVLGTGEVAVTLEGSRLRLTGANDRALDYRAAP